ncbi:MAG: glycosyltransferase family 1 protein, partial [Bergeyella zoohelcum]|nr:glycosyltransferase family 1 protein [Bergeyella zoohelcum]
YIVCISEFVRQDFLKNKHLFNLKKLKDIVVIHNGIELPEDKNYDLGRFSHFKNKKYILNIGVLFEKKNQKSLVEMLPYVEEDLVLLASGEKEPYASKVRERIIELGISDRVHFLKNISEEEKYALIQNCTAMCHPSTAEGFGIPPIEAMAFGKPVFLSKYTSLPEIGGDKAFYFDNFNAKEMANTFNQKMELYNEHKEQLSAEIKRWASQFDFRIMAKNYMDFYQKLLK